MKYKVIKEYAGIEVGSEVKLSESSAKYMIEQGYVELIDEVEEPNEILVFDGFNDKSESSPAQNKAIEPKYEHNVTFSVEGSKLTGVLTKSQKKGRK